MNTQDETLISAFIAPEKRNRYKEKLSSQTRSRFLDRLNHSLDLDERFITWLKSNSDIYQILVSKGAPSTCYLMSAAPEIDQKELPLKEAIEKIDFYSWGTLLSAIPGKLAYYHDEWGERRGILERRSG